MQDELTALFAAARAGELTPQELQLRLAAIHERHLGDAAHTGEWVEKRREAMAAYEELSGTIERHHSLERLARAFEIEES